MGNLFIVFTPLQLFVSQQIIRQENLKNNVVIFGWYNTKFKDVFEMMYIAELWKDKYIIENIGGWYDGLLQSFKDALRVWRTYKK